MNITISKLDDQCKFDAWSRALKASAPGPCRMGREEVGVVDGGTHMCLCLIHVDVLQKPSQYYKVIILQLNKLINNNNNEKQKHYFTNKSPSSPSYGSSSSHVRMWELEHREGWVLKNWCFPAVVLEKILDSPLDCKEIQPVNLKGNQLWMFI